jgi:acyl-CoA thioesterase YciA
MDEELPPLSELAIRTFPMPCDTNFEGKVFGGWIMSQMDLAGARAAHAHAGGPAVTVAVDGMVFKKPVQVGDEISIYAKVTRVGRTSMTIWIETWRRARSGDRVEKVTEANYKFVAIDESGHPRPVPPLPPTIEELMRL